LVTVKVETVIVAGFIGLLNVAVITAVLGQTSVEPSGGVTDVIVGGVSGLPGFPAFPAFAFLSESLHPATRAASRNAEIQILVTLALCISFSCSTADNASFVLFHRLPHVRIFEPLKSCSGTNTHIVVLSCIAAISR
jgi:hypothetical protein